MTNVQQLLDYSPAYKPVSLFGMWIQRFRKPVLWDDLIDPS